MADERSCLETLLTGGAAGAAAYVVTFVPVWGEAREAFGDSAVVSLIADSSGMAPTLAYALPDAAALPVNDVERRLDIAQHQQRDPGEKQEAGRDGDQHGQHPRRDAAEQPGGHRQASPPAPHTPRRSCGLYSFEGFLICYLIRVQSGSLPLSRGRARCVVAGAEETDADTCGIEIDGVERERLVTLPVATSLTTQPVELSGSIKYALL